MVVGQANDLQGCECADSFLEMYSQKTAALIVGAFGAGAICADADFEQIERIGDYAMNVGIAFRLADDLLDEDKNSIVGVWGKEKTHALLERETQKAIDLATTFANAKELSDFATALCGRKE